MEGYNLEYPLLLPVDRHRSSINQRSGLASTSESFSIMKCRCHLSLCLSHHVTLFQLGLAIFYVFLFKLTHGQTDLCIASINANRYRSEVEDLIGMFVSTLPYRIVVDGDWSFDEVVETCSREMFISTGTFSLFTTGDSWRFSSESIECGVS